MNWLLGVPLLAVPVLEFWLLLVTPLPLWSVVGWSALTACLGWWVARSEGLSLWTELESDFQNGIVPTAEGVEAMLLVLGGWGLIVPGWLTDMIGALLLIPQVRNLLVDPVRRAVRSRLR